MDELDKRAEAYMRSVMNGDSDDVFTRSDLYEYIIDAYKQGYSDRDREPQSSVYSSESQFSAAISLCRALGYDLSDTLTLENYERATKEVDKILKNLFSKQDV